MSDIPDYLIVGAGCFGASTAFHLKQAYPNADVVLVDRVPFPSPVAAAHDLNKIIRAEYADPMYMRLALEAMNSWSSDPVFQPFFHQTGVIWCVAGNKGEQFNEGYEKLLGRGKSPMALLSTEEARQRFPILSHCDLTEVSHCVWNPSAGWGDAAAALRAFIQSAVDLGVRYEVATVSKVMFEDDATCTGVSTADGRQLLAKKVILASGAYTPWLLAESAPDRPYIHADERMAAAGVLMCAFTLDSGEEAKFKGAPVIVYPYGDFPAECIPLGSSSGAHLVKCTHECPYTNKVYHEPSKQEISVQPSNPTQTTWSTDLPDALKENSIKVKQVLFKDYIKGMRPEKYRLCWDASTPDEDWIISPHPSKNLYIAGGGSFHGWKFLPIIGKYVVQMLGDELSEEHASRWAWDRNFTPIVTTYTPRKELRDVPGFY
ncbi:putative FAD dependent oxidoreductase domain-containing protein [Seiridium cardinale]|uniref:FAD dependent oxidoreductase domain-containing protein n=1 Tax=Seiridium cardinale TaxID=138064 RepID=A0ABR2X9X2_9PEZI